jgi:hypothetical protein
VTDPVEQARSPFTAEYHAEFKAAATTSPRRFPKKKYGEDLADYNTPSEFVAATIGEADPSGPSHPDPDELACDAMTPRETGIRVTIPVRQHG